MMSQQFQQPEPPNRSNTLKDVGWPIILVIATVLGSIIGAIILGTTHVIGFNWLLIIWGCIMLGIAVFFAWYTIRTRQKLQEQYNKDIADIKSDVWTFKNDYRRMREEETRHWNEWAIAYSQANAKEQAEHLQDAKNELKKDIADAKAELTEAIHKDYMTWNKWVHEHAGAHEQQKKEQKERLEEVKRQLDEGIESVNRNLSTRIQNYWTRTTEWENTHNVTHGEEQKSFKHQIETLEEKLTDKQLSESGN